MQPAQIGAGDVEVPTIQVGRLPDEDATRPKNPPAFGESGRRVEGVLDHVVHHHEVEALVSERGSFQRPHADVEPAGPGLLCNREVEINA